MSKYFTNLYYQILHFCELRILLIFLKRSNSTLVMNKKLILIFAFILFIAFRSQADGSIVQTYYFHTNMENLFNSIFGNNLLGQTEEGFTCRVLFEKSEYPGLGPLIRIQVIRRGELSEGLSYRFDSPTQNMSTYSSSDGYAYELISSYNARLTIFTGVSFYSVQIIHNDYQNLKCKLFL